MSTAKLKDFTTGDIHDVTDREFVVRRAYRINDSLPDDARKTPKWLWQRGGLAAGGPRVGQRSRCSSCPTSILSIPR